MIIKNVKYKQLGWWLQSHKAQKKLSHLSSLGYTTIAMIAPTNIKWKNTYTFVIVENYLSIYPFAMAGFKSLQNIFPHFYFFPGVILF